MKRFVLATGVLVAVAMSSLAEGGLGEMRISGDWLQPAEDQDWDGAYGIAGKYAFMFNHGIGFALAAGAQKWKAKSYSEFEIADLGDGFTGGYAYNYEGDATMFPLGGSALYRVKMPCGATLLLECGARYVVVQSDISADETLWLRDDWYGGGYYESASAKVDISNGVIGLVGIDGDWPLTESLSAFLGAGYQFDIKKCEFSVEGGDESFDTKLAAPFVHVGLAYAFGPKTDK